MKRLSWKYVAGLVDGEGCIDVQVCRDPRTNKVDKVYTYVRPRVRIAMAEPGKSVIDLLLNNFGGNLEVRRSKNPNWSDAYTWALCGKQLRPFLQNILNHLIIKREQAALCLFAIDNVMGKHVPDTVRERLTEELKAMKRDPQRLSEAAVRQLTDAIVWPTRESAAG